MVIKNKTFLHKCIDSRMKITRHTKLVKILYRHNLDIEVEFRIIEEDDVEFTVHHFTKHKISESDGIVCYRKSSIGDEQVIELNHIPSEALIEFQELIYQQLADGVFEYKAGDKIYHAHMLRCNDKECTIDDVEKIMNYINDVCICSKLEEMTEVKSV